MMLIWRSLSFWRTSINGRKPFSCLACTNNTLSESPKMNIQRKNNLDMHCHVAGIGSGSEAFISEKIRKSWKYRIYLKSFGVTEEQIKEKGDAFVIEKIAEHLQTSESVGSAVLLALDSAITKHGETDRDRTETYIPNSFLAAETAKYENLYFGASVNPYRLDALSRLEEVKKQGAVLVKWLPAIQHIDPADPKIIPFYQKLVELSLPLLTHAGDEHSFTTADNSLGDPLKIELPLQQGVTVIAAHAATSGKTNGQDNMQRLLPLFAKYPNLYTDISSLTQINKIKFLPKLLQAGVDPTRLLYGTDFPLITTGLTDPLFSIFNIGPRKTLSLKKIKNPWDQDVHLKLAYGVPEQVFSNAYNLLIEQARREQ